MQARVLGMHNRLDPEQPMVLAEGVTKSFGSLQVLKGIDLEVARGQVVCLLGPSGSGKSTFLRCINHLETIDAGWLSVDGELVGYRRETPLACRNVMVRTAMAITVPWMREPSLITSVSADAMDAKDRIIAAAMTTLLMSHVLLH